MRALLSRYPFNICKAAPVCSLGASGWSILPVVQTSPYKNGKIIFRCNVLAAFANHCLHKKILGNSEELDEENMKL
jgi:hypothetical protein